MLNSMREAISPRLSEAAWQRTALMPPQADYAESAPVLKDRRPFFYFDCLPDGRLPRERCGHRIIVLLAAIFI
jgi:hypothetical protein